LRKGGEALAPQVSRGVLWRSAWPGRDDKPRGYNKVVHEEIPKEIYGLETTHPWAGGGAVWFLTCLVTMRQLGVARGTLTFDGTVRTPVRTVGPSRPSTRNVVGAEASIVLALATCKPPQGPVGRRVRQQPAAAVCVWPERHAAAAARRRRRFRSSKQGANVGICEDVEG